MRLATGVALAMALWADHVMLPAEVIDKSTTRPCWCRSSSAPVRTGQRWCSNASNQGPTLLASILMAGSSSFVVNAVSTANGFSMPR